MASSTHRKVLKSVNLSVLFNNNAKSLLKDVNNSCYIVVNINTKDAFNYFIIAIHFDEQNINPLTGGGGII